MVILPPVAVEYLQRPHPEVPHRHGPKERQDPRSGGQRCWPFVPGQLLVIVAQVQSDLSLDHSIHQYPDDRQHRQRRNPLRFLEPHR